MAILPWRAIQEIATALSRRNDEPAGQRCGGWHLLFSTGALVQIHNIDAG